MDIVLDTSHRPQRQPITPYTAEQKLSQAIRNKEGVERVRRLVEEEGADISCLCDHRWTPLTLAAYLGQVDTVAYLLHYITQCLALHCGAKLKEEEELVVLENKFTVNIHIYKVKEEEAEDGKNTVLVSHRKSDRQHPTTMRLLQLCSQASPRYRWRLTVDSMNDSGESALHCAAQRGHTDVCLLLLEGGADINTQCQYSKQSPLLAAVEARHREVVTMLVERGADVQVTDNVGITPLYSAVEGNCLDIVHQLIQAGCDVNVGSQDHAPLFLAARKGYLSIVKVLCEAGCYKDIANKYGVTALYEASIKGHNSIVEYLIEKGCDLNRYDMYKVSPLQAATIMRNLDGVRLLVNAGACVKWRNSQGKCAVQMALESGLHCVLHFFLLSGIDVTRRPNLAFSQSGRTSPLRIVFENSAIHPETVLLLLRGCSRLDLRMLSSLGAFGTQPALLELAFASGLTHPPCQLLSPQTMALLSPQCQQWLQQHRLIPQSLKSLSRACIRGRLGNTIFHTAPKLPLPAQVVNYLLFSQDVLLDL